MRPDSKVAIIGAGPYGLSCAAFLRHSGVEPRIFGEPMGFWRSRMPSGMLLRSRRRSSHIADPRLALTIDRYEERTGDRLPEPIELDRFLAYSDWFRSHAAPDVDNRRVRQVDRADGAFSLTLEDGDEVIASRVVVAAGLEPFAWMPPPLGDLPPDLVSHSSHHRDLAVFSGRRVIVVGGGQSALESAALLHEAGADVEIVARALGIVWLAGDQNLDLRTRVRRLLMPPTDVGGMRSGWMAAAPELLSRTRGELRQAVTRRCVVPAGAAWLRSRLERVTMTLGRAVVKADQDGDGVRVALDDGTAREADHVVLGTGFRIDVAKYPFLSADLVRGLELHAGYPRLGPGLEASIPGLHFVGAPALRSYGPLMRFVVGTWHAAPAVVARVMGRRPRMTRLSYKPRIVRPRAGAPARPAIGRRPGRDHPSIGGNGGPGSLNRIDLGNKPLASEESEEKWVTPERVPGPR